MAIRNGNNHNHTRACVCNHTLHVYTRVSGIHIHAATHICVYSHVHVWVYTLHVRCIIYATLPLLPTMHVLRCHVFNMIFYKIQLWKHHVITFIDIIAKGYQFNIIFFPFSFYNINFQSLCNIIIFWLYTNFMNTSASPRK